jgi:PST family polysaccharide transporter
MLKALFAISSAQVLAMAVLLLRTKILALLLGPELVGVLAVIDKVMAVFVQTASLSLPFAAILFLPRLWQNNRQQFFVVLRAMSWTLTGLTILATLAGLTVLAVDSTPGGAELQPYRASLLVAFLTIPIQALAPFIQNAFAVRSGPHRSMAFYLAHVLVSTVAAVFGAWWSGLSGLYGCYAVMGAVLVAVALVRLRARDDSSIRLPRSIASRFTLPWDVWRFGLALVALAFVAPYAALFLHYRVLSELGPQAAGWMQAAMGIALAVRAVLGAAHPVFLTPNVNRGGTPAERMRWAAHFQRSLCLLTGVLVPSLLLFPSLAVRLLYSAEFVPGASFVFVFVLVEVVGLLAATYQAVVLAVDRLGFHVGQNIVAQLLTIAVGWVAIPSVGIAGAALAMLSAQAFLYIATTAFLSRSLSLTPPSRSGLLTLYVFGMLLIAGGVGRVQSEWELTSVLLRLALDAILVAGLAAFLTPEELVRVSAFRRSVWARFHTRLLP